jgi:hypothetical protein
LKERGTDDDVRGAASQDIACPLERADATANATWQRTADTAHQPVVVALGLRGIQIDQLYLWPPAEAIDPFIDCITFECQPLSLYELNDPAAEKIDGGNEHGSIANLLTTNS